MYIVNIVFVKQVTVFLISNFRHVLNVIFFLLGDSLVSEFYVLTFQNTAYSLFIVSVSRKNNWDAIFAVFIHKKVQLKNSLSQSEGEGTGMEHVRVEKQAVEGKHSKWRPIVNV